MMLSSSVGIGDLNFCEKKNVKERGYQLRIKEKLCEKLE